MIIVRAPYRISFLGGGTDFPVWYNEHKGAVLSTTINKYCYIAVRWLPPFFEHKHRIVYSAIELPNAIENISHPSVRETCKLLEIEQGIEIHHYGDLPAKTGMGTSSSFTVALLHALSVLKGIDIDKKQLANIAIHIEQNLIKECVGSQDQTASAYGGLNRIDFSSEDIVVKPIKYNTGLEDRLMLFFTGFQRNAVDIEKEKLKNIPNKKHAFGKLQLLTDYGEEALNNGKLEEFGRLLHIGWKTKKSMAHNTSTDYINFLYQQGLDAGAIGGKLLGAGGGGFLLFYVEPDAQDSVKQAMRSLLQVPFKFENKGSEVIFNNDKGGQS